MMVRDLETQVDYHMLMMMWVATYMMPLGVLLITLYIWLIDASRLSAHRHIK